MIKKDKKLSEDDRHPSSLSVTYSFGRVPLIIVALMFLHRTEDHINTCQMCFTSNTCFDNLDHFQQLH